eukprot:CAMPEP_0185036704 /NCGR_PEP_ID=MMETSP1103-20130426/30024_1 /TAXON_ID=36769 /ORGANISM="Paraphysomonas bandaiensis, Strain Caron Lab Isolate" /LENGTH=525 /DNA_ID=CAMNT_0027574333 /DNA_START=1 /DNA_END=1578 /DNA_ORIENTATION=+
MFSIATVLHTPNSATSTALHPQSQGKEIGSRLLRRNHAFLYFKPDACISTVIKYVRDFLVTRGFSVASEGDISASTIEKECLIDRQYATIARSSTLLKPSELKLNAPAFIRFQKKFGSSWSDAINENKVFNAVDAASVLSVNYKELYAAWLECVESGKMIKLGHGMYCGMLTSAKDTGHIFCINGFYMEMRAKYIARAVSVHYFCVEWDNELMSWETFNRKVVGSTNPSVAHSESIRAVLAAAWKDLGLSSPLNMESNAVHASASAFEAMAERSLWLSCPIESDVLGSLLLSRGISLQVLKNWIQNPIEGGTSVFERMLNKGTEACIDESLLLVNRSDTIMLSPSPTSLPPLHRGRTLPPLRQVQAQGGPPEYASRTNAHPDFCGGRYDDIVSDACEDSQVKLKSDGYRYSSEEDYNYSPSQRPYSSRTHMSKLQNDIDTRPLRRGRVEHVSRMSYARRSQYSPQDNTQFKKPRIYMERSSRSRGRIDDRDRDISLPLESNRHSLRRKNRSRSSSKKSPERILTV